MKTNTYQQYLLILPFVAIQFYITPSFADEVPTSKKINTYIRGSLSSLGKELISPVTTEARTWFIIGGTSTLLLATVFRKNFVVPLQEKVAKHKPLGKYTLIGHYGGRLGPSLLYSLGMYGTYFITKDPHYLVRTISMMKAMIYSGGLTSILKPLVKEQRPNGRSLNSFPSGHATAAFAFSSYVAAEHGLWPWGIGALALSTLTAFSRMNDNKHYLHDVVAGATIGAVFGVGLQSLYKRTKNKTSAQGSSSNDVWRSAFVLPVYDTDFKGLSVSMEF